MVCLKRAFMPQDQFVAAEIMPRDVGFSGMPVIDPAHPSPPGGLYHQKNSSPPSPIRGQLERAFLQLMVGGTVVQFVSPDALLRGVFPWGTIRKRMQPRSLGPGKRGNQHRNPNRIIMTTGRIFPTGIFLGMIGTK